MQITANIEEINLSRVEQFVNRHPHGNFFQSTKAYQFFKAVDNYEPLFIVVLDGDEITGSLLAVLIKESGGLRGYLSRRCIVWGGPLVKNGNSEIWVGLLNMLERLLSGRAIYTEFRNFKDLSDHKALFEKAGYRFNEHLNYIVSIPSQDKIRAGLSKSKKRQINKSLKNGAVIGPAEHIDQVKSFYGILETLYREKVKKPLPAFYFFSRFFQDKTLGNFLIVQLKGRVVGGIMCPVYKDTIYEWFVCGMDGKIKDIYPSVLATWAPIKYAADNELKYFDFMGAGKPDQDYGVREFKSKFGGDLVNFGRFVRVNQKLNYQVGKLGLEILKRVS